MFAIVTFSKANYANCVIRKSQSNLNETRLFIILKLLARKKNLFSLK